MINTIYCDCELLKIDYILCPRNILNYDVQQKSIVDLEDWKNQQMILFNEKVNMFYTGIASLILL